MTEETDKLAIARQVAKLFRSQAQMAKVPPDVQLMAIELLAKTAFTLDVKEERRLQMFDTWSKSIRDDINPKKKGKTNGK